MKPRNRGLPVWMTGETYARATLAGADVGKTVDQFVEWATLQAITVHERQLHAQQPGRPFVRRQRSASENQAGRPSSRQFQNGTPPSDDRWGPLPGETSSSRPSPKPRRPR